MTKAHVMLAICALEVVLLHREPVLWRMLSMALLAGLVPDYLCQRATRERPDVYRLGYMTFIGAQIGFIAYHWLGFAAGLPLVAGVVIDQTVYTIPMLTAVLFSVEVFAGQTFAGAVAHLGLGDWQHGRMWRTLRLNWIYWALLAKPVELGLVHAGVVAAEDLAYIDGALIVAWYVFMSHATHDGEIPSPIALLRRLFGRGAGDEERGGPASNGDLKVIWADLDNTLRPTFGAPTREMVAEIDAWLEERALVVITNSGWHDVKRAFVDVPAHPIAAANRHRLIIACVNGGEIYAFERGASEATLRFDCLAALPPEVRSGRDALDAELVARFGLDVTRVPAGTSPADFSRLAGDDPRVVMRDHKGAQISYEVLGGRTIGVARGMALNRELRRRGLPTMKLAARWRFGLPWPSFDLRDPIIAYGSARIAELGLPLALVPGKYGVDIKLACANKGAAVRKVLELRLVEAALGVTAIDYGRCSEAWGDHMTGPDADMVRALPSPAIGVSVSDERGFPADVAARIISADGGDQDPIERARLRFVSRRTLGGRTLALPVATEDLAADGQAVEP